MPKLSITLVTKDPNTFICLDSDTAKAYHDENRLDGSAFMYKKHVEHLYVTTIVKAYGASREDPDVRIVAIGGEKQCKRAFKTAIKELEDQGSIEPDDDIEEDGNYWRGVDANENIAYIVEYYTLV